MVGRFDRDTIECQHTMDGHSYRRHWPVIASRLEKAGLVVVARHEFGAGENPIQQDSPRDSSQPEFEDVALKRGCPPVQAVRQEKGVSRRNVSGTEKRLSCINVPEMVPTLYPP